VAYSAVIPAIIGTYEENLEKPQSKWSSGNHTTCILEVTSSNLD
jgi:hypothetical protein